MRSINGPVWFTHTLIMKVRLGYARIAWTATLLAPPQDVTNRSMQFMNSGVMEDVQLLSSYRCVHSRKWCSNVDSVYKHKYFFLRTIQIVHSDAFGDALRLSASIRGIAIILSPLCQPNVIIGSPIRCGKLRPMATSKTPKLKSFMSSPKLVIPPSSS